MFETESKSDRTRRRIREAALASFIEHGYADTTMRSIARSAEVAVGNAYYYFPSKTHLVQELFADVQHAHAAAAQPLLADETSLVERLRIVFETGLDAVAPYHRVAPGFLAAMMPSDSPVNPLAAESAEARALTVGLFRTAVDEADHRLPSGIATVLPEALFVTHLALVLRWSYDSPDGDGTRRLLRAGLRLLGVALPFVRVPVARRAAQELLTLVAEVRP